MGSLQNIGNRGSNAAQQLAAQLSRSGGSSNPGVHAHQQNMLGGSGVGSGSSWGTGKRHLNYHISYPNYLYKKAITKFFVQLCNVNQNK